MKSTPSREEALFSDALAQPPAERGAFLARACGADVDLLAHLVALLAAHEGPESLMESAMSQQLAADLSAVGSAKADETTGSAIGRYKLLEKLGEGGCGAVWAAEQREPVKRRVALKIIKLGMDTRQVIARFEAERQALAMMDHPNIAKMLDAGATETGRPYFVMELVRGIPITTYCDENQLTTAQRLDLAIKVCHAIQHAHQKGIIHRDIKPSNVLITLHDGVPVPKVIDFGIAKATQQELTDKTIYTKFQQFIGTPAYMSPEQAEMSGLDIDTRSDVYSLGVLVYELVTGRTPFDSKELLKQGVDEIRRTIKEQEPPRPSTRIETMQGDDLTTAARRRSTDPRKLAASVRGDLDWIVMKCLEKDRTRRYDTANGLAMDVQRYLAHEPVVARPPSTVYRMRKFVRRHRTGVMAAAAVIGAIVVGSILTTAQAVRALRAERAASVARENEAILRRDAEQRTTREAKVRWAREQALPEINALLRKFDITPAFELARQAKEFIPTDPALTAVWPQLARHVTIETTPAGADVYIKPYEKPDAAWQHVGKTPLRDLLISRASHRWQFRKEGHAVAERADSWWWLDDGQPLTVALTKLEENPPGMVRVQVGARIARWKNTKADTRLDDYWLDAHEVTNRAFKAFVDAGGYSAERYWRHPFVEGDKTLSWSEAMALFRDRSGHPGPAGWSNGTYVEGTADFPVTGVSWFEATAYAEFAGKRLPSVHHWREAAHRDDAESIVPLSNFSPRLAPVGKFQGITANGTYDMAGNAKEWCSNEDWRGRRMLMGGGAGEPEYMFLNRDPRTPFDRNSTNGFRCMMLIGPKPLPPEIDARLEPAPLTPAPATPITDQEFEIYKRMFSYDRTRLDPRVERVDETPPTWRVERVSFKAAYGGERMGAILYLPKRSRPPYQTVVYFPGSWARQQASSEAPADMFNLEPLLESGRAVLYPIYKSTYERKFAQLSAPTDARELRIQLSKDLGRSIDYLETRKDIQIDKLAYCGFSWGAGSALFILGYENRIKVNILIAGGYSTHALPEFHPINYLPRITAPTLMVNGRHDYYSFPLETSQKRLFEKLGTPAEHKRHAVFNYGHQGLEPQASAEVVSWLDRYLGPVK